MEKGKNISRRDFLKRMGTAGAAAAGLTACGKGEKTGTQSAEPAGSMTYRTNPSTFFSQQSGGVGKGGDIFAESLPVRIKFEFDPLGFSVESDQGVEVKLKLPKRRFVQHLTLSLRMICMIIA